MQTQIYLIKLHETINYPLENLLSIFSSERRQKILSYRQENDRRTKILAEFLARALAAKKIFRPIEEVLIKRNANGKPYIMDSSLQISLSHSRNWVACSIGSFSSGVDVEEDFSDALEVAKNFFSPNEYLLLNRLSEAECSRKFLSLWTLKESYGKFLGTGISEKILQMDIQKFFDDNNKIGGQNFFLPEGAVAAICTEKKYLPETLTILSADFLRSVWNKL